MVWAGIDRRKFPRVNYECNISMKTEGERPEVISTRTENIGIGGICVVIKKELTLFKDVELEVTLEDSNPPVRCGGSVVWVVKKNYPASAISFDIGIEFTNIKGADRNRIGKVVEKVLPSP